MRTWHDIRLRPRGSFCRRIASDLRPLGAGFLLFVAGGLAWETGSPPWGLGSTAHSEEPAQPIIRLDTPGPQAQITGLCFSPAGDRLYVAGFDKVVWSWQLNRATGRFVQDFTTAYRVPVGPGLAGAINCLSVSPDGKWLAVAGRGTQRGEMGFHDPWGVVVATTLHRDPEAELDAGTIFVFDTATGSAMRLRQHRGAVHELAFAQQPDGTPLLASMAEEGYPDRRLRVIAWDLRRAQPRKTRLLEHRMPLTLRPQLRAWTTKTGAYVSVACGKESRTEGKSAFLGVWDVGRNVWQQTSPANQGYFSALARGPTNGPTHALLVGSTLVSAQRVDGAISVWTYSAGGKLQSTTRTRTFPSDRDDPGVLVPMAVDQLPATPLGGSSPFLVLLGRIRNGKLVGYELRQVDPGSMREVRGGRLALGLPEDGSISPRLAVSRAGYVAVTGMAANEVHIYRLADLGKRGAGERIQPAAPQRLGDVGVCFRQVAFVRNDKSLGLRLRTSSDSSAGAGPESKTHQTERVFDLTDGRLLGGKDADRNKWRDANSAATGWEGTQAADQLTLTHRPSGVTRRLPLPRGTRVVRIAVSTGTPQLAAVATFERESAKVAIFLYDLNKETRFRALSGHTMDIYQLTFSDDGSLLASVAADATTRIWNMSDAGESLGHLGQSREIRGVALRGGGVTVDSVEQNVDLELVRAGDTLAGHVRDGKLHAWKTTLDFYQAFAKSEPGSSLVVRRLRDGNGEDIRLASRQGVDARHPLFSLFFPRTNRKDPVEFRGWIAWTVQGSFDASDRQIERLLGWHFNLPQGGAPASFHRIDAHRDKYYRPGLMRQLLEDRRLVLRNPRPQRPLMALALAHGRQIRDDEWLLRTPSTTAELSLFADDTSLFTKVELRIDRQPARHPFQLESDGLWTATIGDSKSPRWRRRVEAVVHVKGWPELSYRKRLFVRRIPPAPNGRIEGLLDNVEQERLKVVIHVEPGQEDLGCVYRLRHVHQGQVVEIWRDTVRSKTRLTKDLTLRPGKNIIELQATNEGAEGEWLELESHWSREEVKFMRKPPPSNVRLMAGPLVPLGRGGIARPVIQVGGHPVAALRQETVRVQLQLDATSLPRLIRQIERTVSGAVKQEAAKVLKLDDFRPGQMLRLDDPVRLQPGRQTIRYTATLADGKQHTTAVEIDFQPRLPTVHITSHRPDITLVEGKDLPEGKASIVIEANVAHPDHTLPFRAEVLVGNGTTVRVQPRIDEGKLRAVVPLSAGENLIDVRLTGAWTKSVSRDTTTVDFLRPPIVLPIDPGAIDEKGRMELVVRIRSFSRPAEVRLGDRFVPPKSLRRQADKAIWIAKTQIWLKPGPNELKVTASNEFGEALEPVFLRATYTAPPPKVPTVVFLKPARDVQVGERQFRAKILLRSEIPLTRLTLLHDKRRLSPPFEHVAGKQEIEVDVVLAQGVNTLSVVVENEDGEAAAHRVLTFEPPPTQLVVESLTVAGRTVLPAVGSERPVRFAQGVAGPLGEVRGYLTAREHPEPRVHVRVNGEDQVAATLRWEPKVEHWSFTAPVLLSRTENVLAFEVRGVEVAPTGLREYIVACEKPQREQRLHVQIIGVSNESQGEGRNPHGKRSKSDQLVEDVVAALHAEVLEEFDDGQLQARFRTATFGEGWIYRPLTGKINAGNLYSRIKKIALNIRRMNRYDQKTDVLLIYYEGGQLLEKSSDFYLTLGPDKDYATPKDIMDYGLDSRILTQLFKESLGASLLLLDAHRKLGPTSDDAIDFPRPEEQAAVIRYAWQKKSKVQTKLIVALRKALDPGKPASPDPVDLKKLDVRLTDDSRAIPNLDYEAAIPKALQHLLLTAP